MFISREYDFVGTTFKKELWKCVIQRIGIHLNFELVNIKPSSKKKEYRYTARA